jgi:hypothetical protein
MPLGLAAVRPVNPLTAYSLAFYQLDDDFAGDVVFPWSITKGDTGTYYIPDARNTLRAEDAAWGWNTGATRVTSQWTSGTFRARKYGFEDVITDDDRDNWLGGGADLDQSVSEELTQKIKLAREVRIEAAIDASSAYSTVSVASGAAQWDNTGSNPRLNVNSAKTAIRKKIGRPANSAVIPGGVWDVVTGSQASGSAGAAILDAIKYTGEGGIQEITPILVARYLNLRIVKPAMAVQQDPTKHSKRAVSVGLPELGAYVWDQKEVYVFYNDPFPGQRSINFGVSFGPTPSEVKRYREEKVEGDVIRIKQKVDEKEVTTAAMAVLTTVIA